MTLRQIGAVVVCAFALSISAAEATQRQKAPRAAAGALIHCVADGSYRSVCPVAAARATGRRAVDGNGNRVDRARQASVSRSCLTSDTRAVLERAERHFGVMFKLVSTCRPGARIAGTNHVSEHAHGRAVDLMVPRGVSKQAVVRWLYANAKGVTMTYRGMAHVHFDTGPYHKLACGGCGERRAKRHTRVAHVP